MDGCGASKRDKMYEANDIVKYLDGGIESLLGGVEKASQHANKYLDAFNGLLLGLYDSLPKKEIKKYAVPCVHYSVQGLDWAKGVIVEFADHYNMPFRDFILGMIKYAETEGPHKIFIRNQPEADGAKTLKHEFNHSFNLGDSEAQVTKNSETEAEVGGSYIGDAMRDASGGGYATA